MASGLLLAVAAGAVGWYAANLDGGAVDPSEPEATDGPTVDDDPPGSVELEEGGDGEGPAEPADQDEQPPVTDARAWRRVLPVETEFGGILGERMTSVTVGGPGLVAVGVDEHRGAAAVWTSTDGLSWQRVARDESIFGSESGQSMQSVTAAGPGLIAVGVDGSRQAAAVWHSADGVDWQRVAHDEAVFSGNGLQAMSSVVAGGPGLVAVGFDGGREAAAVWTSTDGFTWQRVAHDEAVFSDNGLQAMSSVVAGGPGLVAVGSDNHREAAAVWTSPDGLSWQRVTHDGTVFGGDASQWMSSVTVGGPGFIAVGGDEGRMAAAVWTSADGAAWQRVVHDEAAFGGEGIQSMASVTAGGPGLVAVGYDGRRDRESAAVWTSTDGSSWQRVTHDDTVFGGDASQWMASVTVGGPGLIAVGGDAGEVIAAVWATQ